MPFSNRLLLRVYVHCLRCDVWENAPAMFDMAYLEIITFSLDTQVRMRCMWTLNTGTRPSEAVAVMT